MAKIIKRLDTKLIHSGEPEPKIGGAIALPIFQSSTFESIEHTGYDDQRYARLSNTPNHLLLHAKLAAIENAEAALVTASGMAAIATTLLTVLGSGDHLLVQSCLYGGTHDLVTKEFPKLGIRSDPIDGDRPDSWKSKRRPNTRAIYVEAMSNPLLEVPDLAAVTAFAKAEGLVSIIDNTFASPVNFRPAELGFDLSLHSCTKYLNGHSDLIAGAVIGRAELVKNINLKLNHLGASLDPHACFLLHRGMKTLAVRMRHQNESTLRIALFLEQQAGVARVNYPGLESHPRNRRARELFSGFGGVLSFELEGDAKRAERFIKAMTLPLNAPSLGGVESLITRPAATSHAGMSAQEREGAGISDRLIRLSVGLEATDDLIEDLTRALRS